MSESQVPAIAEKHGVVSDALSEHFDEMEMGAVSDQSSDRTIPFLAILQKSSPQVNKKDPEYVEGAEPGMLFNTATKQTYDGENTGVVIIPAFFRKNYVEWVPRTAGGGYVGTHSRNTELLQEAQQVDRDLMLPNGHQLVETDYYFCAIPETEEQIVLGLSSTNLKASRDFQAILNQQRVVHNGKLVKAPSFFRMYRAKTVYNSNDKGDWYSFRFTLEGKVEDDDVLLGAAAFAKACKEEEVTAAPPTSDGGAGMDPNLDSDDIPV